MITNEFYSRLGSSMEPPITDLNESKFLNILDAEYHKFGTSFLNIVDIKKIFNCNEQDADTCIKLYVQYYGIKQPKLPVKRGRKKNSKAIFLSENEKLKIASDAYNKQGEYILKTSKISKLLHCSLKTAKDFINYFCKLYQLKNPLKSRGSYVNNPKLLKRLDKCYEKYGVEFFTTKNIMQKIKCGRVTANKILKTYSEKYNFQCPLGTCRINDEYIVKIYTEYLKKGISALNVENVKNITGIKSIGGARRHIKRFCLLYNLTCPLPPLQRRTNK